MKKILLITALSVLFLNCEEDKMNENDNQKLDSFIIENYFFDAKQLYFHEIFQDSNHPNYQNEILDQNEIDKILKIIQAVYYSDSPERDTVFDIHKIHGYYCYSFSSISLKVDTEAPEIKNLVNKVIPTGETKLDDLLNLYDFDSIRTSYSYPKFPWLTIYTDKEFNMIPLEEEFKKVTSIEYAEFNKGCIGDGNTIELTRNDNSATITFSIGKGDCPAGCIYRKHWEFEVSNGSAKFIKTY
ncbi:hypothetical protein [Seonamhaeicola marinus]|uniref:Uncharacterized protein n=1 Tax=Seonamhaeicola marinus TaxID=1912246 RepID=A0A5D0HJN4_9FLAO|nr:hypothetical protein [Seonamhaeicola marinus]TYA71506.1 hypothetical protein FUA24_18175 [Seonamhaeicola marinus]